MDRLRNRGGFGAQLHENLPLLFRDLGQQNSLLRSAAAAGPVLFCAAAKLHLVDQTATVLRRSIVVGKLVMKVV